MFWSKIWFFLVAVAAAFALTIALVLPRPAARAMVTEEQRRLTVSCGVIGILLADDARKRVDLAGSFARTEEIVKALEAASAAATLDEARMKQVRGTAETVMKGITGDRKPDFAMLIDRKGRVVARVRLDEKLFGDLAVGRPLVDDALAGYLRDDLWAANGTLYFVSASPVVKLPDYVGAVVLGHQVTNGLAQKLVGPLNVDVGFYLGDNPVATSKTIALDQATLKTEAGKLSGGDLARDCQANQPFPLRAGTEDLTGIVARLPGEASARGAFYTVFINRPVERGFLATLGRVRQNDLSFSNFPWFLVAGGFLLVLGGGIAFMLLESDRPLRRLAAEAVRLAKGEVEKLSEDAHPGKFGSIARSYNIHLDKLGRETSRTSKKDIEQLLGPAPEGSLGTVDLLATALPAIRPGGSAPAMAPPPSEFRFGDSGSRPAMPAMPASSSGSSPGMPAVSAVRTTPVRPGTPPPAPPRTPPMGVRQTPPGMTPPAGVRQTPPGMTPPAVPIVAPPPAAPPSLQDDLLDDELIDEPAAPAPAAPPAPAPADRVDPYFKQVFDQFVAVKKTCGESIAGLTYDKFVEKLIRNRDELRAKTACREVRFTVYVKDGKAALKATPVKDD